MAIEGIVERRAAMLDETFLPTGSGLSRAERAFALGQYFPGTSVGAVDIDDSPTSTGNLVNPTTGTSLLDNHTFTEG